MAGMNLHQIGIEPIRVATHCPHGRHVTRVCEECDPIERHEYYGNERLIHEYLVREDGNIEDLICICGNASYKRQLWESWTKTESVDLSLVEVGNPESTADVSSAEYDDDGDNDPWECDSCGSNVARRSHLWDLLEDMDKEPF